jgi:hypothetical protein
VETPLQQSSLLGKILLDPPSASARYLVRGNFDQE